MLVSVNPVVIQVREPALEQKPSSMLHEHVQFRASLDNPEVAPRQRHVAAPTPLTVVAERLGADPLIVVAELAVPATGEKEHVSAIPGIADAALPVPPDAPSMQLATLHEIAPPQMQYRMPVTVAAKPGAEIKETRAAGRDWRRPGCRSQGKGRDLREALGTGRGRSGDACVFSTGRVPSALAPESSKALRMASCWPVRRFGGTQMTAPSRPRLSNTR